MGVRVVHKSGEDIIKTISENVSRMLSRKMDAVKCIYKEAEKLAEQWDEKFTDQFSYYSMKYSNITIEEEFKQANIPSNMQENASYLYT